MKEPKHFLIVEDSESQVYYEKLILNLLGANVDVAKSLKETKEKLVMNGYDFILLDLGLPDSKGKNTLKRVREMTNDKIVVMTGTDNEKLKKYAIKVNVHEYIVKGDIEMEVFEDMVDNNNDGGENKE